ncbi:uncharacterized protein SOCE836_017120 [Sorangium cellulosum]|uniref:Uncharacterized protein n=1 Tax=Sorangium cellulosum TaxID=56 RepID=A0A4P2QJ31_SORCE|nr:uncharacterized protein SOCE836_017120 [Sorangium cellulosum]WCQ89015.1 hypothetical protein NQZ70_01698 [Sorangium sp. Soce836]
MRPRLASPRDASLSARRTCPAVGRGSGPGERHAGGEREAGSGRRRRRAGATHGVEAGGSRGTGAGRDRSDGRGEAGRGSGCTGRGGRRTTTTGSMPPFSGPGARLVMKVGDSGRRSSRRPEGGSPRAFDFSAGLTSTPRRRARPRSARGPAVNGERRRSRAAVFTDRTRDATLTDSSRHRAMCNGPCSWLPQRGREAWRCRRARVAHEVDVRSQGRADVDADHVLRDDVSEADARVKTGPPGKTMPYQ